ncbi:serine acetyltransferase [Gardnerella sp. DNF00257]|uniref:serine O-acetyltransferase EpsC n=1 Tax=Gardnerella sp. DNF00257 TaxID=2749045 RepID=UPI000353B43B|nr:putative serine O-acetyltransferase [Gardnerella vaginalis JCP8522]RIY21515.1 serine acetyltransferase [Bifidobacteriaceae bacterium VN002]
MSDRLDLINQLNSINDSDIRQATFIPNYRNIIALIHATQALLLPELHVRNESNETTQLNASLNTVTSNALDTIERIIFHELQCYTSNTIKIRETCNKFINTLPTIKKLLLTDIQAMYEGDPACTSKVEVTLAYPGFYAMLIHRTAHALYELNVPLIPRLMSEYAHRKTGIDIHPGAKIGAYFCIDHGTGIVIGETTVIGEHVKLYQGVTLGAKSFALDENGNPVKDGKRHPNIGNNVVIYANATILGGETTIGSGSTIAANAWINRSIPANTTYHFPKA